MPPFNVTPKEVEQVFANDPIHTETRIDRRSGEQRELELGHTNSGRVLFVAWTSRAGRAMPVTAYDASRAIRLRYHARRQ